MNEELDVLGMIELMALPGFCVQQGQITHCNSAAQALLFAPGMKVSEILKDGAQEYSSFSEGCLFLTLVCAGIRYSASVRRYRDTDVFLLEDDADSSELKSMALAARELREPLSSIMTIADRLFPVAARDGSQETRDQVARINRGLYQMLRVISNMSDAARYSCAASARRETLEINGFYKEIFDSVQPMVAHTGVCLTFEPLEQKLYCLADREKLERAVMNILSNAIKFTPAGGTIQAKLIRSGGRLAFTVRDSGCGIPEHIRGNLHNRHLRQPGLEDGRFGIGLGMVLIRSAAAVHGGTVLIDHPDGTGTRITMTMAIDQDTSGNLRSNVLCIDYAGERDHGLIELSQCLPSQLYASHDTIE